MNRIKNLKENTYFHVGLYSVLAMSFMSYGSFDPRTSGFWLSVFWGVFMTVWFKLLINKHPRKDKAPNP